MFMREEKDERGTGTRNVYQCFCGYKEVFPHICDKKEGLGQDKRRNVLNSAIECAIFFSFASMLDTIHWLWRLSCLAIRTVG
jgi:hypothetical protein